jgi:hypothetical protein
MNPDSLKPEFYERMDKHKCLNTQLLGYSVYSAELPLSKTFKPTDSLNSTLKSLQADLKATQQANKDNLA